MKRKLIIFGVLAAAVIWCAVYLWGPGQVPAGQIPLTTLSSTNANSFETAFDAAGDTPTMVLLLSPT
jgi:hypothetical protein